MVKHCVIVVMVLIYLQQLLQHVYFLDFTAVKSPVCLQKQSQQIYYNGIKALDQTGCRGCHDVMSH